MWVLVTGGTGVVGKAAVDALLARGHAVRLLSRHADRDARQWGAGVEPFPGDVGDDDAVRGAAEGCGAVLHVAGIAAERPPEVTFENVNVRGTRRVVEEARRAGVGRFVLVSSLGAERGSSEYHRSKWRAEEVVREAFPGEWLVLRPGNVYGPGDEVVSLLLRMVRTLPAVPVIGDGSHPFQPIRAEDLGEALARAVEPGGPSGQVLELAGEDVTTVNDLLDLMEKLTGRSPVRVPVPAWLARSGAEAAGALGVEIPVNADQVVMLLEENVIPPGRPNALTEIFGVTPTPLGEGIGLLADALPERLPSEGVGALTRDRYWADLRGSRLDADALFRLVCEEFATLPDPDLLRVGAEPGSRDRLEEGATLSLAIPVRGTVQVRVEEVANRTATAVTLEGHPLSGAIRFSVEEVEGGLLRFEVRSFTRPSGFLDQLTTGTVGAPLRRIAWTSFVEEVVRRSGGEAVGGVRTESEALDETAAADVERWVEEVVMRSRARATGGSPHGSAGRDPR